MKRSALLLLPFTVPTTGSGVPAVAHKGHNHNIMGSVKSKAARKVEAIEAGTRIVITGTQPRVRSFTAKTIEVGGGPQRS